MGAIWDVIVDIREASGTFAHWFAVELSAENRRAVYVPGGFAHGFQTLTDDVEVMYQMSTKYAPHSAGGIRFDDPQLAVSWPLPPQRLSDRDLALPMLRELDVMGLPPV